MSIILGHRGASAYAPENTMEAFRLALEMGADGLELDVHLSKDGEMVIIHDETVDRTTNGTGYVRDMTLAELKALDASKIKPAYAGARIPTMREVFELIQETNCFVNIEIKTDHIFYPEIEAKCLALAKEMGVENNLVYSSFNHYSLLKLRQLKPDCKLGMLFADVLVEPWTYAEKLNVEYLHPMKANVYVPNFAEGAKAAGYGVNVWTVNDEATMQVCLDHDLGIITNNPDIAVALRKAHQK